MSAMRQYIVTATELNTLSGPKGSALAWHTQDAYSILSCSSKSCNVLSEFTPFNTWSSQGTAQSIEPTISEDIVRCWLWSTATRSSLFGYFSRLLQVVYN